MSWVLILILVTLIALCFCNAYGWWGVPNYPSGRTLGGFIGLLGLICLIVLVIYLVVGTGALAVPVEHR
jgi:DNA-binding transcriptional regulator of glucitol operon